MTAPACPPLSADPHHQCNLLSARARCARRRGGWRNGDSLCAAVLPEARGAFKGVTGHAHGPAAAAERGQGCTTPPPTSRLLPTCPSCCCQRAAPAPSPAPPPAFLTHPCRSSCMRQAGQSRCRRRLACRLGGLALPTCACIMLNAAPLLPAPPQVDNFEKYFVFEPQPGSLEWRILEEACAELSKLSALIDGKIKVRGRGQGVAKRRLLASGWNGRDTACWTTACPAARIGRQEGAAGAHAAAGAGGDRRGQGAERGDLPGAHGTGGGPTAATLAAVASPGRPRRRRPVGLP